MTVLRSKAIIAACFCIVLPLVAHADGNFGGNIDLSAFRPAMDSRGYITVNSSQTLGTKETSFGLITNWGRNLLTFKDGDIEYQVTNIITPTLVGAIGLDLPFIGLEFGASIPVPIMSGDRDPDNDGGTPADPNDDENFRFDAQGLGDIGVHLKARLLDSSKGPGIGLAVIGSLYLPTASKEDNWLGEDKMTPQITAVLDKEFGELGQFKLSVNGGIRFRTGDHQFSDIPKPELSPIPASTGEIIEAKTTIPLGIGASYSFSERFGVVAEVIGAIPLDSTNYTPLEALAGIKVYMAENSYFSLGGGAGLIPDEGGNPDFRAFIGIVLEPDAGDRDRDGIKDEVDKCPDDPEDRDGFQDDDGCPDHDNDGDGIKDRDDECPNVPENKNGIDDDDGCPEGTKNDRDGDGILDNVDKCPDEPEDIDKFEDDDGCPDPDNDGDGILDVDDLCPNEAEDVDKFEDKDGCPDTDNDKDNILDVDDKCPGEDGFDPKKVKETWNGKDDDDGCPDEGRVLVTDTSIDILDKIYFDYNKATIKRKSFGILDAIAATLKGNTDILLVEIQGHTDERGSDSYNLKLSDARAASVKQYLVDKGIDPKRLQSQGYGERQPKDLRKTEVAYAKNRRVEFVIIKREE